MGMNAYRAPRFGTNGSKKDKIEDGRHSVRPSMTQEKIKQARDVILKDCRLTIRS